MPQQIDSAAVYNNEAQCAAAITASRLPREEIFFTSKVRNISYEGAKEQVAATLAATQLDYIDLMLLHCPYGGSENRKRAWKALVEAVEEGKVRSIGVSNYGVAHLDELEKHIAELEAERGGEGKGGILSVGQWEIHCWCQRNDIVEWCRKRGVAVEAYSPLVRAQRFGDATVQRIAARHGKTEAQVLIRWSLQKGFVPLPKSTAVARLKENADVFGWELSADEVEELGTSEYAPVCWDPTTAGLDE